MKMSMDMGMDVSMNMSTSKGMSTNMGMSTSKGMSTSMGMGMNKGIRKPAVRFSLAAMAALAVALAAAPLASGASPAYRPGDRAPYAEAFNKVSDPGTNNAADYLLPSTLENGRIWTDKTVNADRAVIYDAYGKPVGGADAEADEFLVTLSALSQSYSIDAVVEPTDTVFVLDISASMFINKLSNGKSRVEVMVEALNGAIAMLMDGNPNNRIAVVAFGGESGKARIVPVLRLGHYSVRDGNFFSMKSAAYIQVSSQIPAAMLFDPSAREIRVNGGTPTQKGIYAGANVLLENNDTTYTYMLKGEPTTVTRKPNIILLSDGGATLGWTDYTFADPAAEADSGDANNTDMGISALAVFTAAYCKQKVHDHYYGSDEASRSAGFYTIGLSIGGTGSDAPAVLDPINNADKVSRVFSKINYNLKSILDDFINLPGGSVITFPALNGGSGSARSLVDAQNADNYVKSYDYTDGYYQAEEADELTDAFQSIAQRIISTGTYSTKVGSGDADFDGYLAFSDALGEYTEFRGVEGLWFDNKLYDGHIFAQEMLNPGSMGRQKFINAMTEHLTTELGARMSEAQARSLLDSSIAAGKPNGGLYYEGPEDFCNKVKYYADSERNWVGNYFNDYGADAAKPGDATCAVELYAMEGAAKNPVSGEDTDIVDIAFQVVTALVEDDFQCASFGGEELANHLKAGQQAVRWYIPASLIPMRTVSAKYDGAGEAITAVQVKETAPVCYVYSVGLRAGVNLPDIDPGYKGANGTPTNPSYGTGNINFYAGAWEGDGSGDGKDDGIYNLAAAFFQPSDTNPYYFYTDEEADNTGSVPLFVASAGGSYAAATSYAEGTQYFTMRECFDATAAPEYIKLEYTAVDKSITPILTGASGVPYVKVGSPKQSAFGVQGKSENVSDTETYATKSYAIGGNGGTGGDTRIEAHLLGNDGRITAPFVGLDLTKTWMLNDRDLAQDEYVQLYGNGIAVGEPALMLCEDDGMGLLVSCYSEHTWNELPLYELVPDVDGNVSFIEYSFAEGVLDGTDFSPYAPIGDITPGFAVSYIQPAWDEIYCYWDEATILNHEIENLFYCTIEKRVVGDVPVWETGSTEIIFEIYNNDDGSIETFKYPGSFMAGKYYAALSAGKSYTIKEIKGGAVDGYSNSISIETNHEDDDAALLGDDGITLNNTVANQTVNVTFTNEYTDQRVFDLAIVKSFSGIAPEDYPADLAFEVVGEDPAGNEIYRNTVYFSDESFSASGAAYECLLTGLRRGAYTVTELYADAQGYGLEASATVDGSPKQLSGGAVALEATVGSHAVEFINEYTKYGSLTIEKSIAVDGDPVLPSDIVFHVVGDADADGDAYERYIDHNDFGNGTSYVLEGVPPGIYTVTENGGDINGYAMEMAPADGIVEVEMGFSDKTAHFENTYRQIADPTPPRLAIAKIFKGLPPSLYPKDLTFDIRAGIAGFSISVDEFDEESEDYFICSLPPDLSAGACKITESGGEVDGYAMQANHADGYELRLEYGDDVTVIFENTYAPTANPEGSASLSIEKTFAGITPEEYPDASFEIIGADGNDVEVYRGAINYAGFVNGRFTIDSLAPGAYAVKESGAEVDGYALDVEPAGWHTVQLAQGDEKTAAFTNTYDVYGGGDPSPSPPPSPSPSPSPAADEEPTTPSPSPSPTEPSPSPSPLPTEPTPSPSAGVEPRVPNNVRATSATDITGMGNPSGSADPSPAPEPVADNPGSNEAMLTDAHIWYIRGYTDNTIRPDHTITRAETAMVFFRLLDPRLKAAAPAAMAFSDVPADEWYGLAVDTLASHGILSGYTDGSFKPDRPITRSELAAVVSRFDSLAETSDNPFNDLDADSWAYAYILSAAKKGWFVGYSDGRFRPDADITRAEFVAVANRVLGRHLELEDIPGGVHKFDDLDRSHWSYTDFMEAVYTHDFVRKEDGASEEWEEITDDGIQKAYNQ